MKGILTHCISIFLFNTMHIFLELNELNQRAETGQSEKSEIERNILSFV